MTRNELETALMSVFNRKTTVKPTHIIFVPQPHLTDAENADLFEKAKVLTAKAYDGDATACDDLRTLARDYRLI